MKIRIVAIAALVLSVAFAASLVAAGNSAGGTTASPFKAAWIYVGPHNDGGWSQAHDQGRLFVQKQLGAKVQTTYKENVPEGPQVAQVIDQLVRDGNKIIFATSFGFQPAMDAASKKYPDVKFEMATGTIIHKNMAEYYGAGEDAIYLSGIAAGAASKSGVVGYVVPFAIPEVIRHTNAFTLGVQKAHQGATVKIIWTNSWFSPDKEKKAAENLKSAGADVIGQNVDSPSAGQYAESAGVPWVGYDSNAQKFAPKSWLTGAVYNWGSYYLKRTSAAMNGTWKTGNYYGSIKDGFALLAPYGKGVSAATKALIAKQKALIVSGKWNEFSGPIYDQKGKLRIKPGHRPTFNDLYS
ncbi:MAG TPA: BMP family ABC transporter substrate-binding protein, partial [Gaiellaceae bacterium]